jgi:DNA-binding MarR family transcriptional regulator
MPSISSPARSSLSGGRANVLLWVLRGLLAAVFLQSGIPKWLGDDATTATFEELGARRSSSRTAIRSCPRSSSSWRRSWRGTGVRRSSPCCTDSTSAPPAANAAQVSDLDEFAEVTHLMREVSRRISHLGGEVASEYDLTPMAANALWYAGVSDAAPSMRELAHRIRTDPSRMTALADELEARGLVERQTDPTNRRVKLLVLTPTGAKLRRSLVERVYEGSPIKRLSPADRAKLSAVLHQALGVSTSSELPLKHESRRSS